MDYLIFGTCLISAHPGSRTLSGDYEGRKLWIKQTVPPQSRIWHTLQRAMASLSGLPILRATVITDDSPINLEHEAKRLRTFKENGFKVPDVLAVYDTMMVLTDVGPQLRTTLDQTLDSERRVEILKQAIRNLAALHRKGLVHGRPYLRDMTYENAEIAFLDLEEDPLTVMPLAAGQARDLWIFLGSASRYARLPGNKAAYDPALIKTLYEEYGQICDSAVVEELRRFIHFLMPVLKIIEKPLIWKKVGTDARQAGIATRCLYECLSSGTK